MKEGEKKVDIERSRETRAGKIFKGKKKKRKRYFAGKESERPVKKNIGKIENS